ncbi:MAG: hypothetical protein GY859_42905 [Desulfobacterales bacterium]|nr:hypothetical protein [Desulfobacterales bacterium]
MTAIQQIRDWVEPETIKKHLIGSAAVYYRIGEETPAQIMTNAHFIGNGNKHSLNIAFYVPEAPELYFMMILGLKNDYNGPGEYRGHASEVTVGVGLNHAGRPLTWTANKTSMANLAIFPGEDFVGTFSVSHLVPGPFLGPPKKRRPPHHPDLDIQYAYFSIFGAGEE